MIYSFQDFHLFHEQDATGWQQCPSPLLFLGTGPRRQNGPPPGNTSLTIKLISQPFCIPTLPPPQQCLSGGSCPQQISKREGGCQIFYKNGELTKSRACLFFHCLEYKGDILCFDHLINLNWLKVYQLIFFPHYYPYSITVLVVWEQPFRLV